jgi:hypothetical protein
MENVAHSKFELAWRLPDAAGEQETHGFSLFRARSAQALGKWGLLFKR